MKWKTVACVCVSVDLKFIQHLSCLTGSSFFPLHAMGHFYRGTMYSAVYFFHSHVQVYLSSVPSAFDLPVQRNGMRALRLALNII